MLFRAIKHQVDKGPVDAVTGKAKYTLNDSRLLREDLEYHTLVRIHTPCLSVSSSNHSFILFGRVSNLCNSVIQLTSV